VLTYVRSSFGNDAPAIEPVVVQAVRAANTHEGLWISTVLEQQTGIPDTTGMGRSTRVPDPAGTAR